MTRPRVYQAAARVADLLLRDGHPLVGFDGLDDGRFQFSFRGPGGLTADVVFRPPLPYAEVERLVRVALGREEANRNGFDLTGDCGRGLPSEGAPQ